MNKILYLLIGCGNSQAPEMAAAKTMEEDAGIVEITLTDEEISLVAGFARVDMGRSSYLEDNIVHFLSIYPTPHDFKERQAEVSLYMNVIPTRHFSTTLFHSE